MNLSSELERAREAERYCRERLLYWKQRRQELEKLIELDDPMGDFLRELEEKIANNDGL